jgi:hypothetical protein
VNDFFSWAWERHHNILSWYIRPLFLVPFCYFACKRSTWGIVLTLIALATSMFWFPKPETVSPQAKEFLEAEIEWLFGEWPLSKILMTLLIPITFVMLGAAFWKRSLLFGLSVVVFMAVVKVTWSNLHRRRVRVFGTWSSDCGTDNLRGFDLRWLQETRKTQNRLRHLTPVVVFFEGLGAPFVRNSHLWTVLRGTMQR